MHILYNSMCTSFLKLTKPTALKGKYGGALAFISCDDSKLLLGDKELVIADKAREALACLNPAKLLSSHYLIFNLSNLLVISC